jgi:hypothetical protein
VLLGVAAPPFGASGLRVHEDVLLAAAPGFLYTLRLQCDDVLTDVMGLSMQSNRLALWPNPLRGRSRVQFVTPRATSVRLEVFDVLGRRVRGLVQASLPAGTHLSHWDGTDDRGMPVAQGVYFLRLSNNHDVVTRRVTVLR